MKNFRNVAIIFATVLALSACQPQVPQLPQVPTLDQAGNMVQQQVPQAADGFDAGDALIGAGVGAAAGYMLGNSGGNRTTVIDNRRPSNYGYNSGYGRKRTVTTTTTTTKRSMFGGRKTVTRSVTRSRRR